MIRTLRCLVWLGSLSILHLLFGCSPADPIVGSPGAGDKWVFTKVSGDNQSPSYLDTLPNRLVVKLAKLNGTAIANRYVRFRVISGNGSVQKPSLSNDIFDLLIPTDFEGKASSQFFNNGIDSNDTSKVMAVVEDSTHLSVEFTVGTP